MEHPTVFPALTYDDPQAAIEFLKEAFGAAEHAVYKGDDGQIRHAELRFGNGIVMFGPAGAEPRITAGIYIVVDDPDSAPRARPRGRRRDRPRARGHRLRVA